jgi:hypothetical protein
MADETRECRIRLAFAHAAHAIAGATLEDAVTAAFADSSLPVPKPSYTKCAKWHQRLLDTGGVEALPRGRHEPTLTDEEVKAASDLIKAGRRPRLPATLATQRTVNVPVCARACTMRAPAHRGFLLALGVLVL